MSSKLTAIRHISQERLASMSSGSEQRTFLSSNLLISELIDDLKTIDPVALSFRLEKDGQAD
jgi:hypothetical protein